MKGWQRRCRKLSRTLAGGEFFLRFPCPMHHMPSRPPIQQARDACRSIRSGG